MCGPWRTIDTDGRPIRRTRSGAVDTEHYAREARRARAAALRTLIECVLRSGVRAWQCAKDAWERQARIRELRVLGARELKDLGLGPGDLEAIARGDFFTDRTRAPRRSARGGE